MSHLCRIVGVEDDAFLTEDGEVFGVLGRGGLDPSCLSSEERRVASLYTHAMLTQVDETVTLTDYWIRHRRTEPVNLAKRVDPAANALRQELAGYLTERGMCEDRLLTTVSVRPRVDLQKPNWVDTTTAFTSALWNPESRMILRARFGSKRDLRVSMTELEHQRGVLDSMLSHIQNSWKAMMPVARYDREQAWSAIMAVNNCDPRLLETDMALPSEAWPMRGMMGELIPVKQGRWEYLALAGPRPKCVRVATFTSTESATASTWVSDAQGPYSVKGNFCITSRTAFLDPREQAALLHKLRLKVERAAIDWTKVLKGNARVVTETPKEEYKPHVREMMERMEALEGLDDDFTRHDGHLIVWDDTPEALYQTCEQLSRACKRAGVDIFFETGAAQPAYQSACMTGPRRLGCEYEAPLSHVAKLAFNHAEDLGQVRLEARRGDTEPQYIFDTAVGVYAVSPDAEDVPMTVTIGTSGSGKSAKESALDSGFLANPSARLASLAMDDTTAALIETFGGASMVVDPELKRKDGINLFAAATGSDDDRFVRHLVGLLTRSLELHAADELKTLSANEQEQVEKAVWGTLEGEHHTLQRCLSRMLPALARKFAALSRPVHDSTRAGGYADYFDRETDVVGLNPRVQEYNLKGLKDEGAVVSLMMEHIFFRITRQFESRKYLQCPKHLGVHEMRYFCDVPGMAAFAKEKAPTWRKNMAGLSMGFQSPHQWGDDFNAVIAMCSTLFFFFDKDFDRALYKAKIPSLSNAELDIIGNLVPKSQFLVRVNKGGQTVSKLLTFPLSDMRLHKAVCSSGAAEFAARDAARQAALAQGASPDEVLSLCAKAVERVWNQSNQSKEAIAWA